MDDKQLQALANELAKNLKTPGRSSVPSDRRAKKIKVEAALNAELDSPPSWGHEKINPIGNQLP